MKLTETATARAHMTPTTNELFDDATLDARLGRGTVAGGLNDQIRFRFDETTGAPSNWKLVADNAVSQGLLASKSGPLLERKVRGLLGQLDAAQGKDLLNVQGIMLSDDAQSWGAGMMLMSRDATRRGTDTFEPMAPAEAMQAGTILTEYAEAQALMGWVNVAPALSRNILTSIGAYTPAPDEREARSANGASTYVGKVLGHELQHRVSEASFTDPSTMPVNWLEEGTATIIAMHGRGPARNNGAWDVSPQQHAGHVGAPDHVNVGWKPWHRDPTPPKLPGLDADTTKANYVDSVVTIGKLLNLAGVDRRTTVGEHRAAELLQDVPVAKVPARLAGAILDAQGIRSEPQAVDALARAIIGANAKGGPKLVERLLVDLEREYPLDRQPTDIAG